MDLDATHQHDDVHGNQLAEELNAGRKRDPIIPNAEQQHDERRGEIGRREPIEVEPEQQWNRHANRHRDAAHARHRARVHLALCRRIENVHRPGSPHECGNQGHGQRHGEDEGEQEIHP
ncbi:MAG: hypothetical protein IPF84_04140 [Proteobacteria bacterium]|nr:hypothetical protein [Pseudomonadota bacterium]